MVTINVYAVEDTPGLKEGPIVGGATYMGLREDGTADWRFIDLSGRKPKLGKMPLRWFKRQRP